MAVNFTSDYMMVRHTIEGSRIADLKWGTASAIPIVVRGDVMCRANDPLSQILCVSIRNGAFNRTYVAEVIRYGIAPENDKSAGPRRFAVSIPGDTTGSWLTTVNAGMIVTFCIWSGTQFKTAPNVWTAGSFMGSTNMLANSPYGMTQYDWSVGLTNVGVYADPNNTGVPPPFETPHIADDLADCQRHWYRIYGARGVTLATTSRLYSVHPVPMRATPALALVGGTLRSYDGTTAPNSTAAANLSSDATTAAFTTTHTTLVVGRRGGILVDSVETNYVAASARL